MNSNRPEYLHKRHADGSGRDGYIHFSNGGFYGDHRPYNFGHDLRQYKVIQRAPFEKKHADFDDYQNWYRREGASIKKN